MKLKQTLGVLLIVATSLTNLNAQVTVGSSDTPVAGALLQLKEDENAGSNSKKGLGLPKVQLADISKLIMGANEILDTDDGGDQYAKHIGLMVYASQKFGTSPVYCPGIYVWEGDKWAPLSPQPEANPDITMTDADGNVYNARWFGDPCTPNGGLYWMRSNLYSTQKGTGGSFGTPVRLNPGNYDGEAVDVVEVSSPSNLTRVITRYGVDANLAVSEAFNIRAQSFLDYAKEYGLSYTWAQASVACPPGWRLPTVAEMQSLRDMYGGATSAAPKLRKASTWKHYYTSSDNRYTITQWGAADGSTTPDFSGFDAVPAGMVENDGRARLFGQYTYWWSSTNTLGIGMWDTNNFNTSISTTNPYMSVRCVQ